MKYQTCGIIYTQSTVATHYDAVQWLVPQLRGSFIKTALLWFPEIWPSWKTGKKKAIAERKAIEKPHLGHSRRMKKLL